MGGFNDEQKKYLEDLVTSASNHSTGRIEGVVEKTMKKGFTAIGVDIEKPFEVQKDMAFVRIIRNFSESIITKAIAIVIASATLAGLGWKFFKIKGGD